MQCIAPLLIFAMRPRPHTLTKFGIFCRLCVRMLCVGIGRHYFYWMTLFAGGIGYKTAASTGTGRVLHADGQPGTHAMALKSHTPWPSWSCICICVVLLCCALLCVAVRCFVVLCLAVLGWAVLCCPPSPPLLLLACGSHLVVNRAVPCIALTFGSL